MTRHGKNATASSVYSYSERQKDAKQSGYGTLNERLGADSMKPFDCCSLSLQPCREPMISPEGFIFDKESILSYIIEQKESNKRKMKIWEAQVKRDSVKQESKQKKQEEYLKEKFLSLEDTPAHTQIPETPGPSTSKSLKRALVISDDVMSKKRFSEKDSVSNMAGSRAEEWKSFWVPQLNPSAEETKLEKPPQKVLCPLSGKPLRFKDFLPVKFTPIDDEDTKNHAKMVGKSHRYMCPVTRDILTNSTRCAYLKTSQAVVNMSCVEMIKKDMIDPLSGQPIDETDIIELQRGGTGYAATNKLEAKLVRPQLELQ